MKKKAESTWQKASRWLFLGLLAYMPLHIFISTWFGASFGLLEVARVAKEVVLVFGAGIALSIFMARGRLRELTQDKLTWLIGGFVGLNILLALVRGTDQDAELLGLAYNVRFFIFFIWAILLARLFDTRKLISQAVRLVLITGALTVGFALLQYLLLPDDALRYIGYTRENGVLPAFFIDDKPDLERVMSTVRDPNSYGSYLIIIIGLIGAWAVQKKKSPTSVTYLAAAVLALFWTFSRSAWIGAVLTAGVIGIFMASQQKEFLKKYKKPLLGSLVAITIIVGGLLTISWNSYWVQNIVFHADEATELEDPNELRRRFWQESITEVAANPLGSGPGTAGLASIRNDERTVLNENYYLQMAQETGVLGLLLFLVILAVVAFRLYLLATQSNWSAVALLASFAGLTVTNFLVHIWANEAVAYTWWGLAGLVIVLSQVKRNSRQEPLGSVRMRRF